MTGGASRARTFALALVAVGLVVFGMTLGGRDRVHPETARSRPVPTTTVPTTTSTTEPAPVPVPPTPGPFAPVVDRVPTSDPVVFLTIDDGWFLEPAVVDFLRASGIPVTLFLLPQAARQDPAYFQAIQGLGASVQDHTIVHPHLVTLPVEDQAAEICAGADELAGMFGVRPWLFRAPYGLLDDNTRAAARSCGIDTIVGWKAFVDGAALTVLEPPGLRAGDVVLLHFRPDLLTSLQVAVDAARAAGLEPARLEEYLPPPVGGAP